MSNYGYQQVQEEPVSTITATPSVGLGAKAIDNGNEYVYVYNKSTSTAKVGYGVCLSASSGYSVTVSGATGDPVFAVIQNEDLEPLNYGWALKDGFGKGEITDSAVSNHTSTTGSKLFKIADAGFGAVTTGATGSTWAAASLGITLSSIGTDQSGTCYFKC